MRKKFVAALGGFPERTPLNPRVTGTLHRDGYRVDKVIFESQPGILVTAALFLPDTPKFAAPYPGVLVPCGHYAPAKAHDEYQSMGALLALNGFAALVFDPLDQGERSQNLDEHGHPRFWGTEAHTRLASGPPCSASARRASRSGTACAPSTTCNHGPRSTRNGSAARATAAAAPRRPT